MLERDENPGRIAVWRSMAEHFLDTETRHEIPVTALRCLEAELTIEEARNVWRYEVSPVVAINLWNVAGEWAGWDEKRLILAIRKSRTACFNRPGPIPYLLYRFAVHFNHGVWVAIERCMHVLLQEPARKQRGRLANDLETLAQHWFDVASGDPSEVDDATRLRLAALYPEPFYGIVKPATFSSERAASEERVRAAFDRMRRS